MKKEIRQELKKLKEIALPETFKVVHGRHMKVFMSMKDDNGNVRNLRFILGLSPSDTNWVKQFERQKRRYFAEQNISMV
jgi:hypothetical protein